MFKIKRYNNSYQRNNNRQYKHDDFIYINPNGWTDISNAIIMNNNQSLIELLREKKIDVNTKNNYNNINPGWTPLFLAVNKQNIEMVIILLENGANINDTITNKNKKTSCLHEAARLHNLKLIKLLIHNGANPCALNIFNRYPSARHRYKSINQYLKMERIKWKLNNINLCKLLEIYWNIPTEIIIIILKFI